MHQESHDECRHEGGCNPQGCGGHEDRCEAHRLRDALAGIGRRILVLSGKGGVGKSTLAAQLALTLAGRGRRVGLLDIDIHGPSIPGILGLTAQPLEQGPRGLRPVAAADNLWVMSVGFLVPRAEDAVIWRGPMKIQVIRQFLQDVDWGTLDDLVVDAPPGTGDEPLAIAQLLEGQAVAVVVTTPQTVAVDDVRRCLTFCRRVGVEVLGVVENMSGFRCPGCGAEHHLFRQGGGERVAGEMGVPFLGRVPLDPAVVEACEGGLLQSPSAAAEPLREVLDRLVG